MRFCDILCKHIYNLCVLAIYGIHNGERRRFYQSFMPSRHLNPRDNARAKNTCREIYKRFTPGGTYFRRIREVL